MNTHGLRRGARLALAATAVSAAILTASPAWAADSASAAIVGRTLSIVGSGGADNIVVSIPAADPNTLVVAFLSTGTEQAFARGAIDAIDASLLGGDDAFFATGVPMAKPSRIDGGGGADRIVGTAGDDVILGQGGNDSIDSGPGTDAILGGGGDDFTVGGLGHDTASLVGGDDTFLWNPGDGSDDVDGGGGRDTLLFNGAGAGEIMSLSPVGERAVFLRNLGGIVMNNDNVEVLDLNALGGADQITVNDMTGTDMDEADIDLSATGNGGAGDGAADVVTVNGSNGDDLVNVVGNGTQVDVSGLQPETRIAGSEVALDLLQVKTLDGNDRVTVDPSATALIGVTTDLGAGQH